MKIKVRLAKDRGSSDGLYTYEIDADVKVGDFVEIPPPPWGGRTQVVRVAEIGSDREGKLTKAWLPLPPSMPPPHRDRGQEVLLSRMETLAMAIRDRDWDETERQYDRVLSQIQKLAGTRGRPYDGRQS